MALDYLLSHWEIVLGRTVEHLELSLTALIFALPLAILIGTIAVRFRQLQFPILAILGVAYTIPSLVILVFLIPTQGIGDRPVIIMLVMYAQVFLVRNIVIGLRGVSIDVLETARGMGMSRWQVFRIVWLPLATPVIIAGVRMALVTIVGLASFGGLISAGGLGRILFEGIGRNYPSMVLAGIIAIVGFAIAVDLALRTLEALTPVARARRSASR